MTLLDATTKERVKTLLGIDATNIEYDDDIDVMITAVSQRFESYMDRPLYQEARTEEYNARPRMNLVPLRSAPVASIASVKNSTTWDWANTTAIDSELYHVDTSTGLLYLNYDMSAGPNALQIVYTAGFATTTSALITSYPQIAMAADLQVVAMWRRKDSPQGKSRSVAGSSIEHEGPIKLIPEAIEALSAFRRVGFGI